MSRKKLLLFLFIGLVFSFSTTTLFAANCPGTCRPGNGCQTGESIDSVNTTNCSLTEICCKAATSTTPSAGTYANPLAFNDVPSLLTAVLTSLQNIVVVLAIVFIIIGALIYITSAGNEKQVTWAKKAILAAVIGLAIAIAAPLFLREIGGIFGWTNPGAVSGFGTTLTLSAVLANILSFLLATIGVVALIALILGAFMYITSVGDPDRADTGKKIVTYAIIGIVVSLAALVIIRQVATFFGP